MIVSRTGGASLCALMVVGCTEAPDPQVEHAKALVESIAPALEHYRAEVGHYPKSLGLLRDADRQTSSDTQALRAVVAAMDRGSDTGFDRWTYASDADTAYGFVFKGRPDSVRRLATVTCSFHRAGNAWCWRERRVSAVRTEMTFRRWGPTADRIAWWNAALLVLISWPVIVLAGAMIWIRGRFAVALPTVAILLNVAAGLLVYLLPAPPAELGMFTFGIIAAATLALWVGVAFVAILKVRGVTSRFGLAAAAVAGGVVGGFVADILLPMICIGTTNCL